MNHKVKSVKLWLLLLLISFVGLLTYIDKVDGRDYVNFIIAMFGIYTGGNVGSKFSGKNPSRYQNTRPNSDYHNKPRVDQYKDDGIRRR